MDMAESFMETEVAPAAEAEAASETSNGRVEWLVVEFALMGLGIV
jgi:hypothetical protein